jgi:hypothetical protein
MFAKHAEGSEPKFTTLPLRFKLDHGVVFNVLIDGSRGKRNSILSSVMRSLLEETRCIQRNNKNEEGRNY